MRHMLARPNIALIARRQMPPTGPCNYFWVSDTIAIDGLIRSDNRGSESIFPLWLEADTAAGKENISSPFVAAVESRLGLSWEVSGEFPADNAFGPLDVFHYIYALFNASTYRQRYRENLRRDFPRVLIPKYLAVWTAFRDIGARLTEIHLSEPEIVEESSGELQNCVPLRAGYPKFAAGQIWLAKEGPAVPASERVWDFHVGAHQVCRKWLRDRKAFDARTLQRYRQIVALIAETLALRDSLDETVANAGGWEAVFSA
jgi:hypothetical protein